MADTVRVQCLCARVKRGSLRQAGLDRRLSRGRRFRQALVFPVIFPVSWERPDQNVHFHFGPGEKA
jgi:hypothetical protein